MRIADFDRPAYKSVGKAVDGYIEIVHPRRLEFPYCMIVNEEGLLRGLPLNPYGSYLYGIEAHGNPIVGDIVILKEGFVNGEPDLVGLSDEECSTFADQISAWSGGRIRMEEQK
jgi:hypothetical protein